MVRKFIFYKKDQTTDFLPTKTIDIFLFEKENVTSTQNHRIKRDKWLLSWEQVVQTQFAKPTLITCKMMKLYTGSTYFQTVCFTKSRK